VRRFVTIALSLSLLLGLTAPNRMFAQAPEKTDAAPSESKKEDASKAEAKKESTPVPIPPEVEAKLEAARRAVAEAIVAAEDAGLVKTTINPPPILDILITGRANDESAIADRTGVSPEVFGAWFTNYGKAAATIDPKMDVRIVPPLKGLQALFDQRAEVLNKHIKAVRDAKAAAEPKKEEPKPEPKKEETKKEEPKPEPKKEEAKKEEPKPEPKKEEAKKEEPKPEPKKEEAKKEEPKPEPKEEAKKEEAKKEEPKPESKEEAKAEPKEEPKKEEAKEEPKQDEAKAEPKEESKKDESKN